MHPGPNCFQYASTVYGLYLSQNSCQLCDISLPSRICSAGNDTKSWIKLCGGK